jgi:hypothetical protein
MAELESVLNFFDQKFLRNGLCTQYIRELLKGNPGDVKKLNANEALGPGAIEGEIQRLGRETIKFTIKFNFQVDEKEENQT